MTSENKPVGNAAAMREALEAALPIMRNCPFTHYNTTEVDAVVSKMEAALSAPPRNCDRFNDSWDVLKAWSGGVDTPSEIVKMIDWLLAPAAEQEGAGK